MEVSVRMADIEDARDLFLLAKDRLLDVNDWGQHCPGTKEVSLTDRKGHRLHRSAHVDDLARLSFEYEPGSPTMIWLHIKAIQYDLFPDIQSESISMLLQSAAPPGTTAEPDDSLPEETILIKREGEVITAHCNAGNELPDTEDEHPDAHLNRQLELHPVLNIPPSALEAFLLALVSTGVE